MYKHMYKLVKKHRIEKLTATCQNCKQQERKRGQK